MSKVYEVRGEVGKRMDDVARDFEFLRTERASLDLRGIDGDSLKYTQRILDRTLVGEILPEEGQVFELFQSGTKIFRGHVSRVRFSRGGTQAALDVQGPGWWMRRVSITDALAEDQAGGTSERPIATFDSGNVRDHIAAFLTRAVQLGVPISDDASGLEDCFEVPPLNFPVKSCRDVLAGLLKWVQDGMFYWDYSGALPKARLVRRASAPTLSYSIGNAPMEDFSIEANIEKEVSRVDVPFAKRNAAGLVVWDVQGSGNGIEPARRQIINVSGPENVAFLPIDLAETYFIRTIEYPRNANGGNVEGRRFLKAIDADIQQIHDQFSDTSPGFWQLGGQRINQGSVSTTYVSSATVSINGGAAVTLSRFNESGGLPPEPFDGVNDHFLLTPNPPSFLRQSGIGYQDITVTMTQSLVIPSSSPSEIQAELALLGTFVRSLGGESLYIRRVTYNWAAVSASYLAGQELIAPHQYGFVAPPANLAADLLASQNFLPFEGSVELEQAGEFDPTAILGHKLNIDGGQAVWSSMGALVQGLDLDLAMGAATIRLGTPARLDSRSLADTFTVSSQNNIVPF